MQIQTSSINFNSKIKPSHKLVKKHKDPYISPIVQLRSDTFVCEELEILNNLDKVTIVKYLNQGREAIVFETNYPGYLIRIEFGNAFNAKKLVPVNSDNGLVIAAYEDNTVQLMRRVKGEPLYGYNWRIVIPVSKDEYMQTFNTIKNLPDESFVKFIRDIVNIREKGHDVDIINPNNILLEGTNLNIVDISSVCAESQSSISVLDFDALVNRWHLDILAKNMTKREIRLL